MTSTTVAAPAWTRVTTIANTIADRYGLERWALRNTVIGLGARQDLYALAASTPPDDKKQLNRIVDQAQEAAKAQSGANLGIALHKLTERIDSGEQLDVPDSWKPDVEAYIQALIDHRIVIHREWIERVVIIPQLRVAGTIDRLVTINNDSVYQVADLKTGRHAATYVHDTALQLALYANASHVWKGHTDEVKRDQYGRYLLPDPTEDPDAYEPMPAVNTATALLIHLPVGTASCQLHTVDIQAGKEAVRLAVKVREWRKRRNLIWSHNPPPFEGGATSADDDW